MVCNFENLRNFYYKELEYFIIVNMDLETEEAILLYLLSERLKNKKKSSSSRTTIREMLPQELRSNTKPKNSIEKQLVPKPRLKTGNISSSSRTTIGEMLPQELRSNTKPKNSIEKQLVPKPQLEIEEKSSSSTTTIGEMLLEEVRRNSTPMISIVKQLVPKPIQKKTSPEDNFGKIPNQLNGAKKRKKRVWCYRIQHYNKEEGFCKNLYQELRKDEAKFFDYFRMSVASFDELFGYLSEHIKKQNTRLRICVSPVERLVVTLRYLATGCTLSELQSTLRVGKSTASKIIRQVSFYIWELLAEQEIPPLNRDRFLEISQGFQKTVDFPHCIGAIDGKYIKMSQPDSSGFSSVVLLAMCDSDFKFTHVEVVPHGDASDVKIFKNSALHDKLQNRSLDIPPPSPLGDGEQLCPYVILGDKGFSMSENLLKSYCGKDLPEIKKEFNRRFSQARQCIDSAFEILINKWKVFQSPLAGRLDTTENAVKAACVLHNFVLRRDGIPDKIYGERPKRTALCDIEDDFRSRASPKVWSVRDRFVEYFAKNSLERENKINLTYMNVKI